MLSLLLPDPNNPCTCRVCTCTGSILLPSLVVVVSTLPLDDVVDDAFAGVELVLLLLLLLLMLLAVLLLLSVRSVDCDPVVLLDMAVPSLLWLLLHLLLLLPLLSSTSTCSFTSSTRPTLGVLVSMWLWSDNAQSSPLNTHRLPDG